MNNATGQVLKTMPNSNLKLNEEVSRKPSVYMQNLVREQVFVKSMDNYIYPAELGLKHFWCMDCGDKFLFKSSYDFHINRVSMKISFFCRICKISITFKNRCKVLSHIRQHVHQMTTLNLADIQVQPLTENPTFGDCGEDELVIPYLEIASYLQILNNNNKKLSTESAAQNTINKVDSIIEQLNLSFVEASQHLEEVFNQPIEIINDLDAENSEPTTNVENNDSALKLRTINPDQTSQNTAHLKTTKNPLNVIDITDAKSKTQNNPFICRFCKTFFRSKCSYMYTDRFNHFQAREIKSTCDICLLVLPNTCALLAHKGIHSKNSPYICPECGYEATTIPSFHLHLSYGCYHFAKCMISSCFVSNCRSIVKHNLLMEHYTKWHTKLVFKCSLCPVACFTSSALQLHIQQAHKHSTDTGDTFYQCLPCSHKLISQSNLTKHFDNHMKSYNNHQNVYSCPGCFVIYQLLSFFKKHIQKCALYKRTKYREMTSSNFFFNNEGISLEKPTYNAHGLCKTCNNAFLYAVSTPENNQVILKCPFCKKSSANVSTAECVNSQKQTKEKYEDVEEASTISLLSSEESKSPNSNNVKGYKIVVSRKRSASAKTSDEKSLSVKNKIKNTQKNENKQTTLNGPKAKKKRKLSKRKNNSEDVSEFSSGVMIPERSDDSNLICAHCSSQFSSKILLHEHIVSHRDNSSAYQCMECGLCFVVKPSLSSHLFIAHGIVDTETYIKENACFNETAEELYNSNLINPLHSDRIVNENQCQICLEQFDNSIDHDKHFRVHGMAFILMKQRAKTIDSVPTNTDDV